MWPENLCQLGADEGYYRIEAEEMKMGRGRARRVQGRTIESFRVVATMTTGSTTAGCGRIDEDDGGPRLGGGRREGVRA